MRWQWLVIAILALLGAAGGAYLGDRFAPEVVGVLASMAVVGFALGALIGVIVSGWWRPPRKPVAASSASNETQFTSRAQDDPTEDAEPEHAAALVEHPPPPPPPEGGEPGWYTDHAGVRRYWDGERWTEIVWRERQARSRKR